MYIVFGNRTQPPRPCVTTMDATVHWASKKVENGQRRATKYILKLPFCWYCLQDQAADDQTTPLVLLARISWHCFFFYKAVNNLIYVNKEVLPVVRNVGRVARSSSSNAVSFIPNKYKTVDRSAFVFFCKTAHAESGISCLCISATKILV